MSFGFISPPHFLKSVTQCSLPSGRIIRISCHWLTHSFKILACLLLADTIVCCQSVSQLSHQPRPVHWTCSVATLHVSFDRQAQIFPHISYQKSKVWNRNRNKYKMIFKTTCIADMWSMFDDDVQYLPTCQLVPPPFWKTLLVFSQWTFCKQKQKNKTLNKILEVLHFVSKWNK